MSIAGCLDGHEDVYLADWHTNEEGARLVAECMWAELGPGVRSWYRGHGLERRAPVRSVGDDVVSAVPVVSLPVTAADLGEGWKASVAIPDVIAACIDQFLPGSTRRRRGGPAFSRADDTELGYLGTNVVGFGDAHTAVASLGSLDSSSLRTCMDGRRPSRFGASSPIVWDRVTPPPALGADVAQAWTGTFDQQAFSVDAPRLRLYVALGVRGADLVEVQLLSSDLDGTTALGDAVVRRLGGS